MSPASAEAALIFFILISYHSRYMHKYVLGHKLVKEKAQHKTVVKEKSGIKKVLKGQKGQKQRSHGISP